MAWNRTFFANLGVLSGVVLSLFIGMASACCADADPSAQKKTEENSSLFKVGTPVADNLASSMPEFARSVFKGTLDSIHGEYYYHVTDGRIDSLFQKEGGLYKPVVSIAYDSLNGQGNYELKKGKYSYFVENGILTAEVDFPKHAKAYWGNGNPKQILTGILYRDNHGIIKVDSGLSELYFENGKIHQQNDWKDKQNVASKQWNENGALTVDVEFPKHFKEYWDNGKPKEIASGILYRNDQGGFSVDSGRSEIYFESGKTKQLSDWKDKQVIVRKEWNENGVLVKELVFPKYYKEYWSNRKIKALATGLVYINSQGGVSVDSGHSEMYFENGKIHQQNDWKDKQGIASKQWNEKGVLTLDMDFPKYFKEYWDNGKPKEIATGNLYRNDQGGFSVDSGHSEMYFENGKISQQNDWKNKLLITSKEWNENGVLTRDFISSKYAKEYWDNGKPKEIMTGLLYWDKGNIKTDNGHAEAYYENGKNKMQFDFKDGRLVSGKMWSENGTLTMDANIPAGYLKVYSENGTIEIEVTGFKGDIDFNTSNFSIEAGHLSAYYDNGKIAQKIIFKEKNPIKQKTWQENGKLKYEFVFPKYEKFYSDNGDLYIEKNGKLYYDDQNEIQIQDGYWKAYYENGQMSLHENYKEKKLISRKVWYENGTLKVEGDISRGFHKEYHTNGKLSKEVSGKFYFDDDGEVILENASEKDWFENGVLEFEIKFPKSQKVFFPDGTLLGEETGTLYYDEQKKIQIQDGTRKTYCHDSGKLAQKIVYKGKKIVSKTVWNESGITTISAELPNRYREFYDDGKLKAEATGVIVEENEAFKIKDGTYKEYAPNGKVTYTATYKDFQKTSENR